MAERRDDGRERDDLRRQIGRRAERKIKARRRSPKSAWFGLGMFGLIGWSVAVPTLAGVALGLWLDRRFPGQASWTLTFLVIGVALGCLNAWFWMRQENNRE